MCPDRPSFASRADFLLGAVQVQGAWLRFWLCPCVNIWFIVGTYILASNKRHASNPMQGARCIRGRKIYIYIYMGVVLKVLVLEFSFR